MVGRENFKILIRNVSISCPLNHAGGDEIMTYDMVLHNHELCEHFSIGFRMVRLRCALHRATKNAYLFVGRNSCKPTACKTEKWKVGQGQCILE